MKHGKKYVESAKLIDRASFYETEEAVALVKKSATAKFDVMYHIHELRIKVNGKCRTMERICYHICCIFNIGKKSSHIR